MGRIEEGDSVIFRDFSRSEKVTIDGMESFDNSKEGSKDIFRVIKTNVNLPEPSDNHLFGNMEARRNDCILMHATLGYVVFATLSFLALHRCAECGR